MEERLYDLIFITRPATPEEDLKKVENTDKHTHHEQGAEIERPSAGAP